jgi:predicted O-methyltransferase YrrM
VIDYGSGSGRLKSNLRKISDIVKYSSIPARYGSLLANLSAEFGRGGVIELGTSLGVSASYLASMSANTAIYTIEGCPETAKIADDNFRELKLDNIKIYNGTFDDMLGVMEEKKICPGLVYIDGDHSGESVLKYFYRIAAISDSETVIVMDDIHSSREMGSAWNIIKQYEKVTLSIDIFRMGMIFFRKGLTRDDIIIRY